MRWSFRLPSRRADASQSPAEPPAPIDYAVREERVRQEISLKEMGKLEDAARQLGLDPVATIASVISHVTHSTDYRALIDNQDDHNRLEFLQTLHWGVEVVGREKRIRDKVGEKGMAELTAAAGLKEGVDPKAVVDEVVYALAIDLNYQRVMDRWSGEPPLGIQRRLDEMIKAHGTQGQGVASS